MKTMLFVGLTALLALEMGCQKSDPPPAATAPVAAAAPVEATTTTAAAGVPAPEDYEAQAEKTITPAATPGVLTQELDKIEKEIGQ
jgi:hypothetical protein